MLIRGGRSLHCEESLVCALQMRSPRRPRVQQGAVQKLRRRIRDQFLEIYGPGLGLVRSGAHSLMLSRHSSLSEVVHKYIAQPSVKSEALSPGLAGALEVLPKPFSHHTLGSPGGAEV